MVEQDKIAGHAGISLLRMLIIIDVPSLSSALPLGKNRNELAEGHHEHLSI